MIGQQRLHPFRNPNAQQVHGMGDYRGCSLAKAQTKAFLFRSFSLTDRMFGVKSIKGFCKCVSIIGNNGWIHVRGSVFQRAAIAFQVKNDRFFQR